MQASIPNAYSDSIHERVYGAPAGRIPSSLAVYRFKAVLYVLNLLVFRHAVLPLDAP
jgi:hypothetical protein